MCATSRSLGAGRDDLAAIVCIDQEAVGHWAEERGVSFTSYADLSQRPEVYELVASVLRHVNTLLPEPLRVRRFVNLHKDFDAGRRRDHAHPQAAPQRDRGALRAR